MREDGISRATTKQIASAAGHSEAMPYKMFSDKRKLVGVIAPYPTDGPRS